MLQNLGLAMDRLAFHYRNLALGWENVVAATFYDSQHFQQSILQYQGANRGGFGPTAHLGMNLRQSEINWTHGFNVRDANAWIYHNNPQVDQATLVQSLLMTPQVKS